MVGADGLHSRVRLLAFGAQERFEHYLGIVVAVFDVAGYRPRDELVAVMHADVGFQMLRVSLRDDVTMFCVTLRDDGGVPLDGPGEQQALLRRRLAGAGWETPAILDAMAPARTFYFDRVSQIRMPSWTRGRVALVGDAAACPSLLAGQGSALAMVEAYVLAVELARADGDHAARSPATTPGWRRCCGPSRTRPGARAGVRAADRVQLAVRNTVIRLLGLRASRTSSWAAACATPSSCPPCRSPEPPGSWSAPVSPSSPRAQQQAILRAALDEFAAHGFHDASLNRIIDAAGISKGSMYYYFDGKEDLFAHVARVEFERLFTTIGPSPSRRSPGRLPSGRPWSATTSTP